MAKMESLFLKAQDSLLFYVIEFCNALDYKSTQIFKPFGNLALQSSFYRRKHFLELIFRVSNEFYSILLGHNSSEALAMYTITNIDQPLLKDMHRGRRRPHIYYVGIVVAIQTPNISRCLNLKLILYSYFYEEFMHFVPKSNKQNYVRKILRCYIYHFINRSA